MEEEKKTERSQKQILKSEMTQKELGERLKKIGSKKAFFARFCGINEQTVRGWKDGKIPLYVERLLMLLEITTHTQQAKDVFEKVYQINTVYETSKPSRLRSPKNK